MNKRNPNSTAPARILTDYKKLKLVWGRMRQSCTDVNHSSYKNYGAKGVTVDAEAWPMGKDFADWALLNGFEPGLTVERIDSAGDYTPSNVRFATRTEQQRNRTDNHRYEYLGEQLTMAEIIEREQGSYTINDINRTTRRLRVGWDLLDAIRTPPHYLGNRHAYQGEMLTLYEIAQRHNPAAVNTDISRLYDRMKKGYTLEEALNMPPRKHTRKPQPVEWLA